MKIIDCIPEKLEFGVEGVVGVQAKLPFIDPVGEREAGEAELVKLPEGLCPLGEPWEEIVI